MTTEHPPSRPLLKASCEKDKWGSTWWSYECQLCHVGGLKRSGADVHLMLVHGKTGEEAYQARLDARGDAWDQEHGRKEAGDGK